MNRSHPFGDPDVELMLRFQGGDAAAFDELVRRHQKAVLNIAWRYCGDRSLADDLAQEIFVKVWRARGSYQPAARFSTWLYRIAVNRCLNEIRSRPRGGSLPVEETLEEPAGARPDDDLHLAEVRDAVRRAVDGLPANQRMAVILSRFHELPYDEIAEAMSVSLEAVKSLLFRARENLKTALEKLVRHEP
ncbi:MAG TPA: sigma-70 family RNA polymerase sigma factor [Planctomycetota bacterium]|nr:sigma-70 family RNA polymerase sigma factor [Planctomycetota bacterium]